MSRYVVLGLAHPRAPWFSEVARWATAGSAPVDFVKCVSAEEVHARLASGRRVSALLADADIPPDQVLRIATASNALALGLERQLGTIEEGKLADLVVVDGNPLVDVGDALNVVAVVRGGVWIDSATLLR